MCETKRVWRHKTMRCHDILGVSEIASELEIIESFNCKINQLKTAEGNGLDNVVLERKKQLIEAKDMCINWKNLSFAEKMKRRFAETTKRTSSATQLNACIGPCTCCDKIGGSLCTCDSAGKNDSFCQVCCGSSNPPIVIDVILWLIMIGGFLFSIYSKKKEEQEKIEGEQRRRREEEDRLKADARSAYDRNIESCLNAISASSLAKANEIVKEGAANTKIGREYAVGYFRKIDNKIEQFFKDAIGLGRVDDAKIALSILEYIYPTNSYYSNKSKRLDEMLQYITRKHPLIFGNGYGSINVEIANKIMSISPEMFKTVFTDYTFDFALWYYTLHDPFDEIGYKVICSEMNKHSDKAAMLPDVVSSVIYLAAKFGDSAIRQKGIDYDNIVRKAQNNDDTEMLVTLASLAKWLEDPSTERRIFNNLNDLGVLPKSR